MKVLIATDGSSHAEKAARFFSLLPHREPLELLIVSVHYVPEIHGTPSVLEAIDDYENAHRERQRQACERIAAMFDGALAKIESIVPDGHPGETLVGLAHSHEVDLVVLGGIGHSMLERILLGSVSEFVATHAKCSVLVVRNSLLDELYEAEFRICYAYDDSERCRAALDDISSIVWRPSMHIDILSVVASPQVYSDIPIAIDTTEVKVRAVKALQQATVRAKVLSNNIKTHLRESSHVADEIVRFCEQNGNHMILLGDTGRGIVNRFFLGSVARRVLRTGSCSVWIGR